MPEPSPDTRDIVRSLQEKIRGWERDHRPAGEIVSSGSAALDHLLADGGFCRGTLVEWLAAGEKVSGTESDSGNRSSKRLRDSVPDTFSPARGSGAATLALAIAARACREGGALVVIDRPRMFYPPAAAGFGIDAKWLVVVRPATERDEAWALDQVLRCPGVGSVLAWPAKLTERRFRRMQLAAEAGGTLGLLVRPERARDEPSWADVRLLIGHAVHAGTVRSVGFSPRGSSNDAWAKAHATLNEAHATSAGRRRILVELLRSRSGLTGGKVELELDELRGALYEPPAEHLAPRLAAPAAHRR